MPLAARPVFSNIDDNRPAPLRLFCGYVAVYKYLDLRTTEYLSVCSCVWQTIVATLHRGGGGLGFSVAGGKGTMPYSVDSEVGAAGFEWYRHSCCQTFNHS